MVGPVLGPVLGSNLGPVIGPVAGPGIGPVVLVFWGCSLLYVFIYICFFGFASEPRNFHIYLHIDRQPIARRWPIRPTHLAASKVTAQGFGVRDDGTIGRAVLGPGAARRREAGGRHATIGSGATVAQACKITFWVATKPRCVAPPQMGEVRLKDKMTHHLQQTSGRKLGIDPYAEGGEETDRPPDCNISRQARSKGMWCNHFVLSRKCPETMTSFSSVRTRRL